jgi:hypothetical protein
MFLLLVVMRKHAILLRQHPRKGWAARKSPPAFPVLSGRDQVMRAGGGWLFQTGFSIKRAQLHIKQLRAFCQSGVISIRPFAPAATIR